MDKEEEEEASNQRTQDPSFVEGEVGVLTATLGDCSDQKQEEMKAGTDGHSEMAHAQLSKNL